MTDEPIKIANAALLKATEALTRISQHEMECARRYVEGREQNTHQHAENVSKIGKLDEKVDTLLAQSNLAQGRMETNRALLGPLANAFWQMVMQTVCGGIGAALILLALKGKLP